MRRHRNLGLQRRGGIYIAVLGTSLIVALLGLSALIAQRIHNRALSASADISQARINAEAALQLGLLTLKQNDSWRSLRDVDSYLFKTRGTTTGSSCSLKVTDAPADSTEAAADKPAKLLGIGYRGTVAGDAPRTTAEQHVEVVVDPRRQPHDTLKSTGPAFTSWQAVFDYYGGAPNGIGTEITMSSLPTRAKTGGTIDDYSHSRNPSLTNNAWYWYDADTIAAAEFSTADVDRVEDVQGHQACLRVQRNSRRAGPANRLKTWLLKPETQYRFDVEIYAPVFGNWFKSYLIVQSSTGYQVVAGTADSAPVSSSWQTRTFTVTTPSWTTEPVNIYFALNSDPSGSDRNFYVDNVDMYETNARFIYQTALGPGINPYGSHAVNSKGLYWINCQGSKLVIERSRIFGTLLILNPGADSQIAYGPMQMSPAVPGYPTLIVNGNFTIRSTPDPTTNPADDDLTEAENGVSYNPSGAPHKSHGVDSDQLDAFDSEIRGLVLVSGNLTYANSPAIRGKVLVGGSVTGTPAFEYRPDSLLNPPPPLGAFYTYRYDPRPLSIRKAVK